MADDRNLMSRLLGYFGISRPPKGPSLSTRNSTDGDLVPASTDEKSGRGKPIKFDAEALKFWKWWLREATDTSESLNDRLERLRDLDYMRHNSGYMETAAEMYADEATQIDSQRELIKVRAEDKAVEKEIYEVFEKIGLDQSKIRALIDDIGYKGEGFLINSFAPGVGLTESTHVDPMSIKDRIEFRLADQMTHFLSANGNTYNLSSKMTRLQGLRTVIDNISTEYSNYFRTFLFGFQLTNETFLPPWNVSHFRRYTSQKEIHPWGEPLFIHSIGLFRQLKAGKTLAAVARAMSLPREVFKITTTDKMTAPQKWQAMNDAREQYNNIMELSKNKENVPMGGQIWTIADLFEYEVVTPEINLDNVKDLELTQDELIISTRIPKGYLIVDRATFGTSGQALLQQYKPFGRAVFSVQSAFLEELANLIRLHFMIKGAFQGELTPFELSLNYPVIEDSRDRLQSKKDSLDLAQSVITAIQTAMGVETPLPIAVVRSIMSKLSFLSMEDINDWIDITYKEIVKTQEEFERELFSESVIQERKIASNLKIRDRLTDDLIRAAEFEVCSDRSVREGVRSGRHYLMSNRTHFEAGRAFEYRYAREILKGDGDTGKQRFKEFNDELLSEARQGFIFSEHDSSTNKTIKKKKSDDK
jgi:hypothetical protein